MAIQKNSTAINVTQAVEFAEAYRAAQTLKIEVRELQAQLADAKARLASAEAIIMSNPIPFANRVKQEAVRLTPADVAPIDGGNVW